MRMQAVRSHVISACRSLLLARRMQYAQELAHLDAAAENETKSSAGDKYETGREMLAQARQIVERNLSETESALATLDRMDKVIADAKAPSPQPTRIGFGSLVETSGGLYLLGISLGEVALGPGLKATAISLASPLGKAFLGKSMGDEVVWKGHNLRILGIAAA
jgi:transcription elongation GreA/GreB family factor